ncbi:MAG: hypothetical protein FWE12_03870 [Oscillospiraceae bacterium]|nr:hypothetical protein [Oscillospiraceae bacterium]
MKIYPNPSFPHARPERPTSRSRSTRCQRIDTIAFVTELQTRNTKALEQNQILRPRAEKTQKSRAKLHQRDTADHCFSAVTGPPIEVPGGHVHALPSTPSRRKRNE